MSGTQLLEFYTERHDASVPLVLVTVVETAGSTYSKPGHRILIDSGGQYHGLVSGGCLEGDLVEHAQRVFADGQARIVTYDLRGDNDELWGLGIGCGGLLRLLLQRVDASQKYEPFASLAAALLGECSSDVVLVYASEHSGIPLGSTLIRSPKQMAAMSPGLDEATAASLGALADAAAPATGVRRASGSVDGHAVEFLRQSLAPVPRILVLGGGPDAIPLVTGFQALGWRVAVGDHRPAFMGRHEFGAAQRHLLPDDAAVRALLAATLYSAVIVMSHNLRADERYLRALALTDCTYVGILGPKHRRQNLLQKLEAAEAARLDPRLHGPIGLDIGADSPASIALSVMAEVHAALRSPT